MSWDGKRAVSGGNDGTVRVWDLESMTCKKVLEEYKGRSLTVSVSSDGKRAASCGANSGLRVWDLESMTCEKVMFSLPGIDIRGINLLEADIMHEETREILRQNGAVV